MDSRLPVDGQLEEVSDQQPQDDGDEHGSNHFAGSRRQQPMQSGSQRGNAQNHRHARNQAFPLAGVFYGVRDLGGEPPHIGFVIGREGTAAMLVDCLDDADTLALGVNNGPDEHRRAGISGFFGNIPAMPWVVTHIGDIDGFPGLEYGTGHSFVRRNPDFTDRIVLHHGCPEFLGDTVVHKQGRPVRAENLARRFHDSHQQWQDVLHS